MDTRRQLRRATCDDLAGIVALARLHNRVSRQRTEFTAGRLLRGPSVAVVIDGPLLDGLSAVLIAAPVDDEHEQWTVELLEVRQRRDSSLLIPALLSAAADRLVRSGIDRLVVPVDPADQLRGATIEAAGLQPASWVLWRGASPLDGGRVVPYEPGLPLPHLHGLRPHRAAQAIRGEGASALVAPATMPFGNRRALEVTDVLDPLVAQDGASLTGLLRNAPSWDRRHGDGSTAVVLGNGEERLSDALRELGYRPLIDWWALPLTV